MAAVIINEDNFNEEVIKSEIPVLVDFWAAWCGPCKMLAPLIEQISDEVSGVVKVCKVNVDDCPELAARYKIVSIPTLVVFENGNEKKRNVGLVSKSELKNLLA